MKSSMVSVTSCVALGLGLVGMPPASAAGGLTITVPPDSVLYEDCYDYSYGYNVAAPSSDWEVDISITDPFGADESGDYVTDTDGPVGTASIYLCGDGIDRPGTYTITAVMTWYDGNYDAHAEPPVSTSFVLAKPATRTALRVSTTRPGYNDRVVFRANSTIQTRVGYARLAYERVQLQAYLAGAWRKLDAESSDGDGITKFRYKWNIRRALKVRTVTVGTSSSELSKSATVTLRVR